MEVPALRSFFFAALDRNGLAVKRMQSFLSVQPGRPCRASAATKSSSRSRDRRHDRAVKSPVSSWTRRRGYAAEGIGRRIGPQLGTERWEAIRIGTGKRG